jgi:hypothetical protein
MGLAICRAVDRYTGPVAPRALSEYDRAVLILADDSGVPEEDKIALVEGLSPQTAYRIANRFAGRWIETVILGRVRALVEADRLHISSYVLRPDVPPDQIEFYAAVIGFPYRKQWGSVLPEIQAPAIDLPAVLPAVLRDILRRWTLGQVRFQRFPTDPPNLIETLAPYAPAPAGPPSLRDLCLGRL